MNWARSENWCSSNDDDFFNRAFFFLLTEAEEAVLGSFSVADHFLCALSHWTASAYWGGTAWLCDNQQTCLCVHERHGANCDVCEWEKKTGSRKESELLSSVDKKKLDQWNCLCWCCQVSQAALFRESESELSSVVSVCCDVFTADTAHWVIFRLLWSLRMDLIIAEASGRIGSPCFAVLVEFFHQ